jgi:hypothetical protein
LSAKKRDFLDLASKNAEGKSVSSKNSLSQITYLELAYFFWVKPRKKPNFLGFFQ